MAARRVTERRVAVRSGAEGPAHDPYAWTERVVVFNGHCVTLRTGALGYARLVIDGRKLREDHEQHESKSVAVKSWLGLTGFRSVDDFDRAYDRAHPQHDDPFGSPTTYR